MPDALVLGGLFLFPALLDDRLEAFEGLADLLELAFRRLEPGLGGGALLAEGLGALPQGGDLLAQAGLVLVAPQGVGLEQLDLGRRRLLPLLGGPDLVAEAVHLFLDEIEAGLGLEEAAFEGGRFGDESGVGLFPALDRLPERPGLGLAEGEGLAGAPEEFAEPALLAAQGLELAAEDGLHRPDLLAVARARSGARAPCPGGRAPSGRAPPGRPRARPRGPRRPSSSPRSRR